MGRRRSPAALSSRVGGSKTPVVAILRLIRHKRPKRKAHYQSAASWINQRACWGPRLASVGRCYFKQALAILCVCCRFSASSFTNASVWRQWACVDRSLYINVYRGMVCGWDWGGGGVSSPAIYSPRPCLLCSFQMSALSVKPSHKAQSMLLGPPCVYLCRQEGSEPTRTTTSTYPSIHPSFSKHFFKPSHSPSLLCSLSLIDRFTPRCDIFYANADASWFVWHASLHPPATHGQMLCSSICVCVCFGFCAAFWFESLSWSIRLLYQSSICGLFISPSQQLSRVTVSRCSSAWLFFISANTFFCRLVLNCRVSSRGRLLLTAACWSCLVLIAF